jgi:hypothetical protein
MLPPVTRIFSGILPHLSLYADGPIVDDLAEDP